MMKVLARHAPLLAVMVLLAVIVLLAGCDLTTTTTSTGTTGTTGAHQFGVQSKTSGCAAQGGLPDSACTPGAIFPDATKDKICQSGYATSVRNVSTSEKDQVYAEYGISSHSPGQYEVDHLVSLE